MMTPQLLAAIDLAAAEVAASAPAPSKDLLRQHLDVLLPWIAAATSGEAS